jgi:cell division protein FtsI (penicillin-binding protein 3)
MLDSPKNMVLLRVYLVLAGVALASLGIVGKVVHIQWVQGEKWRGMADSLYIRFEPIESEMGNILTEEGTILATSTASFEIRMDLLSNGMNPTDFAENVDSLGWYLSRYIDSRLSPVEWAQRLRQARMDKERYHLIARNKSFRDIERVRTFPLLKRGKYKGGLIIVENPVRTRPFGKLARRTIGIHQEGHKSFGLEAYYKDQLIGEQGYRLMQYIPGGGRLPVNDLTEISPTPGYDIVTTLDVGMQDVVHAALEKALIEHKARTGIAVVMEVATGKVRAMVNLDRDGSTFSEQYNHAVGSAMEPGSIFKLASMLALLDDKHVSPTDLIDVEKGRTTFYDRTLDDAYLHGLDTVTVQEAFEMSSNVGIAKLVQRYYGAKPAAFYDKLARYGLTQPIGIDLQGEAIPMIKHPVTDKKEWTGITLPWMSMGYELKVTPLQMLTLYAAVANEGRMMRPMLVTEFQKNGDPVRKIHPQVLSRRIASSRALAQVRQMMEGVVENGTAKAYKTKHYAFAGKTGTARMRDLKEDRIAYRSSFAGYFPADQPRYAAIVVVEDPKGGKYYGSEIALPVFRDIADYCFQSRREMFPVLERAEIARARKNLSAPQWEAGFRRDFHTLYRELHIPYSSQAETDWAVTIQSEQEDRIQLQNRLCPDKQVPSVVGMGLRDALYLLESQGLKVDPVGMGRVRRQSVSAGIPANGQYVRIHLE